MNAATALIALVRKLEVVEQAVEDLRFAQQLQGETLHNKISKLQGNNAQGLVEMACSSDEEATLTPTAHGDATTSLFREMEIRLQMCEKEQQRLATCLTEGRNEFCAISALKVIEERLEKIEESREHLANEAEGKLEKMEESPGNVAREAEITVQTDLKDAIPAAGDVDRAPDNSIRHEQQILGQDVSHSKGNVCRSFGSQASSDIHMQEALFKARHYEFQGSVYDAAFFVGTRCVATSSSLMLTICLGINLIMQVGLITILGSDQFTKYPFAEGHDGYRTWRYSASHALRKADEATGTSLAARVCHHDESLDVATMQMANLEQASTYLAGNKGPLACYIAIALWFLNCAVELRRTVNFVIGIFYVPKRMTLSEILAHGRVDFWKSNRSIIFADEDGVRVVSLSILRVAVGLGLAACRISLAALMLYYGCRWLACTQSILDLLLNASALSFVLNIDETIYDVLTPLRVQGVINAMHPLKLPADYRLIFIPLSILAFCFGFSFHLHFEIGRAFVHDMEQLNAIICSNQANLDFVLGTNVLGQITFAESSPYSASHVRHPVFQARLDVAQLVIDGEPTAGRYFLNESTTNIERNVAALKDISLMTLVELTEASPCVDLPWNPGSESDAKLGGLLWAATGQEDLRGVTMCSEIRHFCHGENSSLLAQNVRFMCPITCGCADPKSGLWDLFRAEAGCPESNCLHTFFQARNYDHHKCTDTSLRELKAMQYWDSMLQRMYEYTAINTSVLQNLTQMGCKALGFLSALQRHELCQSQGVHAFHGAGFMCPISCGCLPDPKNTNITFFDGPGLCPHAECRIKFAQA